MAGQKTISCTYKEQLPPPPLPPLLVVTNPGPGSYLVETTVLSDNVIEVQVLSSDDGLGGWTIVHDYIGAQPKNHVFSFTISTRKYWIAREKNDRSWSEYTAVQYV